MKNLHQNLNQLRSKENMKASSGSKKSHQHTHEYVYQHEITKDVASNNNVIQSYISSPKCGMKFLQHQMDQARSKENHESPSDSSEYHRCIHFDVYHHNLIRDASANVTNMVLYSFHHQKERQKFHNSHVAPLKRNLSPTLHQH